MWVVVQALMHYFFMKKFQLFLKEILVFSLIIGKRMLMFLNRTADADNNHFGVGKDSELTAYIERFNGILRQRASRLVRKSPSFSKSLENHIGAIKCFICHYNLQMKALH